MYCRMTYERCPATLQKLCPFTWPKGLLDGSFSCPRRHAAEFDIPPVATIGCQRELLFPLIDHGGQ